MNLEIAKAIVEAGENIGAELELREKYSGRGMFGKETAGITYRRTNDLLKAIAATAIYLATDTFNDNGSLEEEKINYEDFPDQLEFKYDNMGQSYIAY